MNRCINDYLDRTFVIENAITGANYLLQPIYRLEPCHGNLKQIAAICNEDLVYEWCFRSLCNGVPYPQTMAREWIQWGADGWQNSTHFVYVVTNSEKSIAAALDIKSADLRRAEIGYWASADHRGIMSNAVRAILPLADQAGFKLLFADIHPNNKRSQAVIRRCGFETVDRQPTISGHIPFERPNR
ncbi:MAG: GNAT family N-acetyltransferase [Opitutales bacterium]|nr:GNAT family N-acetyltransferase [Opitutales bacterium]NRA25917.1 GNAT family N-acetyltransferase [Opitutales bacterium]